ncbi:MAG: flagellar basal-body MS-ring/collar protein FliF [Puniceicoccaceae bacterium]
MNVQFENWRKFWTQLGPNQRVSILFSVFVVVAGMIGLFTWAQRPDMRLLYGSVSPKDASAIIANLDAQDIPYEMRNGGSAIYVPADMVYQARMDAASQGLVQGDAVGFEIFDKSSFGISDFVQRTNFIRAVQGELSRTIQHLNGVRSARVMVVMPDNKLLLVNKDVETTASVFVDVGGSGLGPNAVRSIQSLVANAVEGLRVDNVAVVDNQGNVLSRKADEEGLLGASTGIVEYRQRLEKYFSEKVESMLEPVVGHGNAVVRVSADIDSTQVSRMQEDFDEDGAVLRSSTSREEITTTVEGGGGVASLVVEEDKEGRSGSPESRTEEEFLDKEQSFEIDRVVTNTVEAPGKIRRLTASVFIAAKVQQSEDPAAQPIVQNRTPEELELLKSMVSNALGIPADDPAAGAVVIQELVFESTQVTEIPQIQASPFSVENLLPLGEKVIGGLIAMVLFLVFLNLLKKSNRDTDLFNQMNQARGASRASVSASSTEMVTPELLNELIRQKPENAGASLRNWLSGKNGE